MTFFDELKDRKSKGVKSFAVLIDPDDFDEASFEELLVEGAADVVDFFFVGGSLLLKDQFESTVSFIKSVCDIPVIIFPGNNLQVSKKADALLLLSLISGRNPEYLIGQHVVAAPMIRNARIEVASTAYILVDGGNKTAVSYMSNTTPIPADKTSIIVSTALAGEMLGMKLIYLETGSGAKRTVPYQAISAVNKVVEAPIIVGGGVKTVEDLTGCFDAGADLVVVGTKIESDPNFLIELRKALQKQE